MHLRKTGICSQEDILITAGPGRCRVLTEASGHGEMSVNNKAGRDRKKWKTERMQNKTGLYILTDANCELEDTPVNVCYPKKTTGST